VRQRERGRPGKEGVTDRETKRARARARETGRERKKNMSERRTQTQRKLP
jgi:hypothetical protein